MRELSIPRALAALALSVAVLNACADGGATGSTITIDGGAALEVGAVTCREDVEVDDGTPGGIEAFGRADLLLTGTAEGPDGPVAVQFTQVRIGHELLSDVLRVTPTDGADPAGELLAVGSDLSTPRGWSLDVVVGEDRVVVGSGVMEDAADPPRQVPVTLDLRCPATPDGG